MQPKHLVYYTIFVKPLLVTSYKIKQIVDQINPHLKGSLKNKAQKNL